MFRRRIHLLILGALLVIPVAAIAATASGLNITVEGDKKILTTNDIPNHENGPFPSRFNPNTVQEQNFRFVIPAHPKYSEHTTRLPQLGPIGVAVNGVTFFNPYNRDGDDAVTGSRRERFDDCQGHPTAFGAYHYHQYSKCVIKDEPGQHSKIFGWAFDGFAVYGPQGVGGKEPTDLDKCNGHVHPGDSQDKYHYHVTKTFPYIIGCYHGEVDAASFQRPMRRPFLGGMPRDRMGDRQGDHMGPPPGMGPRPR